MMMEASPRAAFEMVQSQVIFGALEVLFDVPARAAQFQAAGFGGRSREMRQVIVIGFGVPARPVHHQPDFFQFAPRVAQVVLQENLVPSQTRAPGLPAVTQEHFFHSSSGILPVNSAKVAAGGSPSQTCRRTCFTSVPTS